MVATRARALTELVERTFKAEQILAETESFEATAGALLELGEQVRSLSDNYWRVAEYLGSSTRGEIKRAFEYTGGQLSVIRDQLRENPKQSNEIGKINKQIVAASGLLESSWRAWSNQQVQPHRVALRLVGSLPEIQEQKETIDRSFERAEVLSSSLPTSDESLQTFLNTIKALESILGRIEGLSFTIREFLGKVVSGQATFDDIDPEILAWIQDPVRARGFRIVFGTVQGQTRKWS